MTNPFAPTPYLTSSGDLVSGGGADGTIDRVVALALRRTNPVNAGAASLAVAGPDARRFDLAELIAQCASAAGVRPNLPTGADALLRYCRGRRTMLSVADGYATKGALLFGRGMCGLSLGHGGKVIIYSDKTGVTVDKATQTWTLAARIPGARGYR